MPMVFLCTAQTCVLYRGVKRNIEHMLLGMTFMSAFFSVAEAIFDGYFSTPQPETTALSSRLLSLLGRSIFCWFSSNSIGSFSCVCVTGIEKKDKILLLYI